MTWPPENLDIPLRQGALLLGCLCAGALLASQLMRIRMPRRGRRRETEFLNSYLAPYRHLEDAQTTEAQRRISVDPEVIILSSLRISSPRIRLVHLRLAGGALPALGLMALHFPLLPALMGGLLGYVVADSWLKGRWHRFRAGIEEELPVFVNRLGAMLLLNESLTACLEEVVDTLDPESSLLRVWMEIYLQGLRQEGKDFLSHARQQANRISPSLALVVFQLDRVVETGGSGFARAFAQSAQSLQAILEVRAVAASKADGARSAIALLLVVMGVVMAMLAASPGMREGYADPQAQMVLVGALGVMAFGYHFLNGMISDVLG